MLQPAQPTVTGATIGLAVPRDRVTPEIKLLSAGSAAALASRRLLRGQAKDSHRRLRATRNRVISSRHQG